MIPFGNLTEKNPRRHPFVSRGFQLSTVIVRCPPLAPAGFAFLGVIVSSLFASLGESQRHSDSVQSARRAGSHLSRRSRIARGQFVQYRSSSTSDLCRVLPIWRAFQG